MSQTSELAQIEGLLVEGMKLLNLTSEMVTEHESDTEAWVNLPELGVSVFCDAEGGTRRTISGEIKVPSFQVYTINYTPASRWEPEEEDFRLVKEFSRVADAVAEVFSLVVKDQIQGMIEATFIGD